MIRRCSQASPAHCQRRDFCTNNLLFTTLLSPNSFFPFLCFSFQNVTYPKTFRFIVIEQHRWWNMNSILLLNPHFFTQSSKNLVKQIFSPWINGRKNKIKNLLQYSRLTYIYHTHITVYTHPPWNVIIQVGPHYEAVYNFCFWLEIWGGGVYAHCLNGYNAFLSIH